MIHISRTGRRDTRRDAGRWGANNLAELRPFRGLRYDTGLAGTLGTLIAPPYDVISPAQQRALHEVNPYNIVQIEYSLEPGEERYTAAGRLLREWILKGVLRREPEPALYLYEQNFTRDGRSYRRRSLLAQVRLHPFDAGVIRPHEYTMSGPKEDRLKLLSATRANISPIFSLYRSGPGDQIAALTVDEGARAAATAVDALGERHTILPITDITLQQSITRFVSNRTLYIADGHHRYETALAYREQRRRESRGWSAAEPENFVMMAIAADDDPGLLILPIHRIVRPPSLPDDLVARLERFFEVRTATASQGGTEAALNDLSQLKAEGRTAFVAAGVLPDGPALLVLRDRAAVEALMPAERSAAWKALDVNVLQYGVLEAALGIDIDAITRGGMVEFTEDAGEALAAVEQRQAALAFLLNATTPLDIFSVADTGDRMPQKSTYFYPKLGTGLVVNSLA